MEDDHELMKEELRKAEDEVIISRYLMRMILHGDSSWPLLFHQDVDVFNKNPNTEFDSQIPIFVIVKHRTENCGKTDIGCESGCWRITGREKPIRSKETGKILGFKKILKFCKKTMIRENNRKWVMEEYRLANNLNWKQDHVICKIRLLFASEISSLLVKHFKTTSESLPINQLLPAYGYYTPSEVIVDESYYVLTISASEGKEWPRGITKNVYGLHPLMLVDLQDQMFRTYGVCIFVNLTETCGETDKCVVGNWKILERDRLIKKLLSGEIVGFKNVLKFYESGEIKYFSQGKDVKVTWTIDEYRLADEGMKNKVLCVLKVTKDFYSGFHNDDLKEILDT